MVKLAHQMKQVAQFFVSFTATSYLSLPSGYRVLSVFYQTGYDAPILAVEIPLNAGGNVHRAVYPVRCFDAVPPNTEFVGVVLQTATGAPVYFFVEK
jgi:hypothetical protein